MAFTPSVVPSASVVSSSVVPIGSQVQSSLGKAPNRTHHLHAASLAGIAAVVVAARKSRAQTKSRGGEASEAQPAKKIGSQVWDRTAWITGYNSATTEDCYTVESKDLPSDLKGTFFRNGPAKFKVGKDQIMHPFDGDGMVAAMTFDGAGRMHFRNRFVRTPGFVEELKAGKMLYRGQFSPKAGGWLANAFDMRVKNLANTNVMFWGGRLLALWEGGKPTELDPLSLATVCESSLAGALHKEDSFTAHPRYDAATGRMVAFQYRPEPMKDITKISFWEFENNSFSLHRRVDQELPGFGFYHDCLVTKHYYILSRAPVTLNGAEALKGLLGFKSMGESISFDASKPGQLALIPRDGSPMKLIDVDAHFCFHFANGFEREYDGHLILDIVRVPDFFLGEASADPKPVWETADMEALPESKLYRYDVNPQSGKWTKTKLCDRHMDFPSVNRRVSCLEHRYTFGATSPFPEGAGPLQGVLKVDLAPEGGPASDHWLPEPHEFLGEPVFCPKATAGPGSAEDDGYVLSTLMNGKTQRSELVVLDAQKISQGPICRLPLKTFLPHGLHGTYVPGYVPTEQAIKAAWVKEPTSLGGQ